MPDQPESPDRQPAAVEISASRQFAAWLREIDASLAFTTYQAGKLFLIGTHDGERLSVFERTFNRCMGLYATGQTLVMSTLYQLWRFENTLAPQATYDGYDRLYVPRVAYTTGDIDVHDVALAADGRVVFANTLFSCVATLSATHNFEPLWTPPFISRLAAEDRCHLNGLALEDGRPRFVSMVSTSDVNDGWRDHRRDGGCVFDMTTNTPVAGGLSMPHSPRVYRDRLWVLDSGNGHFGFIDRGRFVPVAFCPGYLRGLAFVGRYAVVGLSRPRHNRTFEGLALEENLKQRRAEPRCGLQVIDLRNGDAVHWLRLDGVIEELYDVAVLPGVARPMALGFRSDEIQRIISFPQAGATGSAGGDSPAPAVAAAGPR